MTGVPCVSVGLSCCAAGTSGDSGPLTSMTDFVRWSSLSGRNELGLDAHVGGRESALPLAVRPTYEFAPTISTPAVAAPGSQRAPVIADGMTVAKSARKLARSIGEGAGIITTGGSPDVRERPPRDASQGRGRLGCGLLREEEVDTLRA